MEFMLVIFFLVAKDISSIFFLHKIHQSTIKEYETDDGCSHFCIYQKDDNISSLICRHILSFFRCIEKKTVSLLPFRFHGKAIKLEIVYSYVFNILLFTTCLVRQLYIFVLSILNIFST